MKEMVKKGVSTIAVPISLVKKKDNTPQFLKKYEPFFVELEKDSKKQSGISLLHYQNPETGMNDVTMIVFDLRLFQRELLAQQPTLADAINNLGIIQHPAPSAAEINLATEAMQQAALANGVINNPGLAEISTPSPQALPNQ
jgi:hypothetical protein